MTDMILRPAPCFSPLLERLIARHGWAVVDAGALDRLAPATPLSLLFLAGDAERLAESNDVAVVLPELEKLLNGHAAIWVAARAEERVLQRRFRFTSFPALVFLRAGGYLGCIEGIRDWADYLTEIPAILNAEPHDPPPYRLPAGCGQPQENRDG